MWSMRLYAVTLVANTNEYRLTLIKERHLDLTNAQNIITKFQNGWKTVSVVIDIGATPVKLHSQFSNHFEIL